MSERIIYDKLVADDSRYIYFEEEYGVGMIDRMNNEGARDEFLAMITKHMKAEVRKRSRSKIVELYDILDRVTIVEMKTLVDNSTLDLNTLELGLTKNPSIYTIVHEYAHLAHFFDMFNFGRIDKKCKKCSANLFKYHGNMFEKHLNHISKFVKRRKDFKPFLGLH